jgi:hypothetical protein
MNTISIISVRTKSNRIEKLSSTTMTFHQPHKNWPKPISEIIPEESASKKI